MLLLPSPTMKFLRRSEQKYIPRIRIYTLSRQAQPVHPPIRIRLLMHLCIKKIRKGYVDAVAKTALSHQHFQKIPFMI